MSHFTCLNSDCWVRVQRLLTGGRSLNKGLYGGKWSDGAQRSRSLFNSLDCFIFTQYSIIYIQPPEETNNRNHYSFHLLSCDVVFSSSFTDFILLSSLYFHPFTCKDLFCWRLLVFSYFPSCRLVLTPRVRLFLHRLFLLLLVLSMHKTNSLKRCCMNKVYYLLSVSLL